jgi:hypothetical protein
MHFKPLTQLRRHTVLTILVNIRGQRRCYSSLHGTRIVGHARPYGNRVLPLQALKSGDGHTVQPRQAPEPR